MNRTIIAYFDGSCESNPGGRIGYGALIDNTHKLFSGNHKHHHNSNNTAEHKALYLIFEWLEKNKVFNRQVTILGDSEIVIRQMQGRYKIKKTGLYYLTAKKNIEMRDLLEKYHELKFVFKWIPREKNTIADELSNKFYKGEVMKEDIFTGCMPLDREKIKE